MKYILDRLREKSTILTILTLVLGFFGAKLSPEIQEQITNAVLAIISGIAIFTESKQASDKK